MWVGSKGRSELLAWRESNFETFSRRRVPTDTSTFAFSLSLFLRNGAHVEKWKKHGCTTVRRRGY